MLKTSSFDESRSLASYGKDEATKRAKIKDKLFEAAVDKAFAHNNDMSQPALGPYLQREQTMLNSNESKQYSTGSKRYDWRQKQGEENQRQSNHNCGKV
jgi:hypothetical protein